MLNIKKFEGLLSEGQRRAADFRKANAPLLKAWESARAAADDIQRELMELRQRLAAFEDGSIDLSDGDYMTSRARVDLLVIRGKRAAESAAAARAAYEAAESTARGELSQLRSEALNAWRKESYEAGETYGKAWGAL